MSIRTEQAVSLKPPSLIMGGLHLAALWALAIVQPLLDLLGSNPDFFVARDNTSGQIVLFVLLLAILPPLVATLIEFLVNLLSQFARWILHLVLCGLLFAAICLQILKQFGDGPAWPMIAGALVLGGLLAWSYARVRFVRSMADVLIIAPPVILVSFFFFSDSSELISSPPEAVAKEVTATSSAPVVMVVFDEFPAGSLMTPEGGINPQRYPNFSELKRTSDWYRNTATNASHTAIAVPSILTGLAADRNSLPNAPDHPDSIFTLLGGRWRTRAIEPITQLCPKSICGKREGLNSRLGPALSSLASDLKAVSAHLLLPASMGEDLPDISQSFQGFGSAEQDSISRGRARQWVRDRLVAGENSLDGEADVEQFISTLDDEGQTFDFVHVEKPHYPWTHYPSGLKYSDSTEDFRNFVDETSWFAPPYLTNRAHQAHLLEVGFTDYLLGKIIKALKERGRWQEALLVVTADHGAAWTEGLNRREASPQTIGQIGMVPLFIKAPGQGSGRVIDRPTCTTEIVPEMARILGIDLPWEAANCDRDTVSIDNGIGPRVEVPFGETIAQRQTYVDRMARILGGANAGWERAFRWGRQQGLIGRAVDSVATEPSGDATPTVSPETGAPTVSTFDPSVRLNPVLRQRGTISGLEPGETLALAVNGSITAVGQSYRDRGKTMYSILVPQSSLRRGRNEIKLFQVIPAAGSRVQEPALRLLWTSSDQ